MSENKERAAAIEGWFTTDADNPRLLGTQCKLCHSYFFPKETLFCRNPNCTGRDLEEVELSPKGTLWSFTNNCYQPPPPYISAEPFTPYAIAAVELDKEKMVVLGQVVSGVEVADLKAGMKMELVLDTLYEKDDTDYVTWKWRPARA